MATRRVIRGVLGNFLGTYTSRYSDHDGYWLFGFLVADLGELMINLLGQDESTPTSAVSAAISSAVTKFDEQRRKADLALAHIREAWLTIQRLSGEENGWVNNHWSSGFGVRFTVAAVMDNGRGYKHGKVVFVAPHNPEFESRRGASRIVLD